ncbi:hypothetical protein GCM10028806_56110 [Spirosoma terrae]|uniref:Uncharacterized protein n=1 Tax=Spirosoma terrae TaxID=1968276 RepID=A0A6L9LEA9_9BACT|nr:hypothetical protein [Spirosoma terrae]NDU96858.1 hypothetical protein [Spirosoma terrae]
MIKPLIAQFAFAGTSVNSDRACGYLFDLDLGYYRAAYQGGETEEVLNILMCTEYFEIKLRRYIAGFYKTQRSLMAEVRMFLAESPKGAPEIIRSIIQSTRTFFLEQEWYELMPRLEKAAKRIESLLTSAPL